MRHDRLLGDEPPTTAVEREDDATHAAQLEDSNDPNEVARHDEMKIGFAYTAIASDYPLLSNFTILFDAQSYRALTAASGRIGTLGSPENDTPFACSSAEAQYIATYGLSGVMPGTAASLTKLNLQANTTVGVHGHSVADKVYVQVTWYWSILPLVLEVGGIVFLPPSHHAKSTFGGAGSEVIDSAYDFPRSRGGSRPRGT